jgi:hypothetical protein
MGRQPARRHAAPYRGGGAALGVQYRYQAGLLVVGILVVVLGALWLMADAGSPVDVLGCVWDRATADATATTAPECTEARP